MSTQTCGPKTSKSTRRIKKKQKNQRNRGVILKIPNDVQKDHVLPAFTCRVGIARKFLHPSKRNVNSWLVILLSCQGAPPTPIPGEDLWRIWKGTTFFFRNKRGDGCWACGRKHCWWMTSWAGAAGATGERILSTIFSKQLFPAWRFSVISKCKKKARLGHWGKIGQMTPIFFLTQVTQVIHCVHQKHVSDCERLKSCCWVPFDSHCVIVDCLVAKSEEHGRCLWRHNFAIQIFTDKSTWIYLPLGKAFMESCKHYNPSYPIGTSEGFFGRVKCPEQKKHGFPVKLIRYKCIYIYKCVYIYYYISIYNQYM